MFKKEGIKISYNIAQIIGLAQQYGLPGISNQQAQDIMNSNSGGNEQQIDQYFQQQANQLQQQQQAQQAQANFQQQSQQAISGLQDQKNNLAGQYGSLLQTVTGEYQPLINQMTATSGDALARRGISPDSQYYQQQVQGALQPVYSSEAANAQTIGAGSIADTNTLSQAIAQGQLGNAQFASQLPLQFGSLSLGQQSLAQALQIAQLNANVGLQEQQMANNAAIQGAQLGFNKPQLAQNQSGQFVLVSPTGQILARGGGGETTATSIALSKIRKSEETKGGGYERKPISGIASKSIAQFVTA